MAKDQEEPQYVHQNADSSDNTDEETARQDTTRYLQRVCKHPIMDSDKRIVKH